MEKWWFKSLFFFGVLEYRCGLSKSIKSLGDHIENTSINEELIIMEKNTPNGSEGDNSTYSNVDHLVDVRYIGNLISDDTFLVRDSHRASYSIYFDIENEIFEIDNNNYFISKPENSFYSYQNNDPRHYHYMYNTKYSWNSWKNHVNNCIDSYLHYQICIDSSILTGSENSNASYIYSYISGENSNESGSFSTRTSTDDSDLTIRESSNDLDVTQKYRHLWVQCENCYGLNYKKFLKSKMNICERCECHLKMSSSDRIELLIDPGTWEPVDEDMDSLDPIEFHSEEEPYKDRIDSYQRKTGLTEAVQTGTCKLNGVPVAIGVMDFQFMGGSMGSVVGEKITRLIESATNQFVPLILVCASGGARMQEGSLSLMQMAKISSALYDYQSNKKLFYVAILTSPTTGGVTASFGMLGDIIIAEPDAYIAFAGKRVIEQTLNKTVPEGSQVAEYLFQKGLFDPIVPRNLLKGVLSELFQLHALF
uniref:acetyl-CoA carboxylase carboxyltransferase beta subunit n=1 Tax=Urtica ardens TaxID=1399756 RepID=UPI00211561C6|nr:acetyl-CoA carboxylase carboxyltransferase beta subunit [Urtica ardens]YP_010421701.1 acetyl-CoA carboxylase carboxyltransferase beta subunit [Urtica mairei]USG54759.1 acetyl-CoA carboxylase carboxyltransferase beta subunit [Urtica ardens]USG54841.1 acetyl-CoA carboxylase carboxyltransferase beta subunit [Urtica ardens]USG55752.1 acetyl-CoA carboxylase carboxyltransferase beta subunit [Urtica mairei]